MKRLIVGLVVVLAGVGQAEGEVILSESFSGAQLVTDSRVLFSKSRSGRTRNIVVL